jgi:polyhydroxyalkanoate synthesis regulator protein
MVNVIRCYGNSTQTLLSGHLDQALRQFVMQHPQPVRERLKPLATVRSSDDSYKSIAPTLRESSNLSK